MVECGGAPSRPLFNKCTGVLPEAVFPSLPAAWKKRTLTGACMIASESELTVRICRQPPPNRLRQLRCCARALPQVANLTETHALPLMYSRSRLKTLLCACVLLPLR